MPHEPLTVGSLFAGIGGIDLGLERAGMVTRWFVEWDAHCQNVLRRHWPGVPVYGDITEVDWGTVEPVDVLAGGFPCQPVSIAGRGRAQDDDRWLWPAFRDAIGALRPRYVLVENVSNILVVNDGAAFAEVLGGLASLGYDAEWDCIPAAAVGAPHFRDRLWLVAHRPERSWALAHTDNGRSRDTIRTGGDASWYGSPPMADPLGGQQPQHRPAGRVGRIVELDQTTANRGEAWAVEPDVGRVANGIPHRMDRLRSLGNAVVPQVVEWIGRRIVAFDEESEVRAA